MASFRKILTKRVFNALITIILIMLVNFLLFRVMPGDPALLMTPRQPGVNMDAIYWRNVETMGLNDTLDVQLVKYFVSTFQGDWGISYTWERPVIEVLGNAICWTVLLLGVASTITFVAGIILGKIAAFRRGKTTDVAITGFGLFFYGMPIFWFGIVLMVIFVSTLHLLPGSGYMESGTTPFPLTFDKVVDILKHMILPVTTLVVGSLAGIILIQRNSLVDVLTEEYIVTAYAKGLSEKQVMKRHATPNARLPVVTTIAMDTAFILGGAFQVEVVFSYKGLGLTTVEAIWKYDFPMLQFIFFIGGVAVVIANLIADIVILKLDPRVSIT
ncbi:MAG: ABC transporter permease [Candidatus Thermoplasmatota archaeon]|nr:ABC transporter permease [Candidatus Thermoplasmatota archaeon]